MEDKEEAIPIYSGISLVWFYQDLQNVGHIQPVLQEIVTNNESKKKHIKYNIHFIGD